MLLDKQSKYVIDFYLSKGVVVDSGDTITQFVPVYEGYGIKHATEAVQIGGRDVTERLKGLLGHQEGRTLSTTAEFQIVKSMKEKHCFVKCKEDEKLSRDEKCFTYFEV